MMPKRRLSTQFLVLGLALLGLALVSIASTMWVTRKLDGGAAAVNEAGRLRMQAWRLLSAELAQHDLQARAVLVQEFEHSLDLLRRGDPQRPLLVPWNAATRAKFEALQTSWLQLRPVLSGAYGPALGHGQLVTEVDAFVDEVDLLVLAIERVLVRFGALLTLFQFVMMALAVAGAILALYMGHLYVAFPVRRLIEAQNRVQAGEFGARIPPEAHDEFNQLAAGFNHMTQTLGELYQGLERRVENKTRDLRAERERLRVLYEVSSFLIDARSMDEITRGFAQRVRAFSQADGLALRWTDPANQRYLMLGSEALPPELVEGEHCIEAGACACGQLPEQARTRVIPIVSATNARLGNCAKAGFVSLITVPIRVQERLLGEIDLFFRHPATLTEADRALYEALASQLAAALEHLRNTALLREAAVSEERTLLARELHDSIAQSLAFLKIQVTLLRQALQRADTQLVQQAMDEIDAGVRESTSDVRELLVHFRTRTNSDDMAQALRATLSKFEHQSGIKTELELQGQAIELPSDVQLQVLHVLQEALSNVRKHAHANRVWLSVERGPVWRFKVRDDGCGFEPKPPAADDTHVGLHIMRERAERIGARVQIESRPAHGTEVCLELPTATQSNAA